MQHNGIDTYSCSLPRAEGVTRAANVSVRRAVHGLKAELLMRQARDSAGGGDRGKLLHSSNAVSRYPSLKYQRVHVHTTAHSRQRILTPKCWLRS